MGNMHCPPQDAAHLAAVAREICPFPSYNPSPHFVHMLSINSSRHLHEHYAAVQRSLTPKQLEDFTQNLRTTFGYEGKVTLGGVGVVALSLAVLFDTLAKQVRGEVVCDVGPIPGLFVKDPRGYYPPHVDTVSKYLRLVPHIANNPTRMRQETERCINLLKVDEEGFKQRGLNYTIPLNEDVTCINRVLVRLFAESLKLHLWHISNVTIDLEDMEGPFYTDTLNLNCDTEAADKDFLAKVENSDDFTKKAFENCNPKDPSEYLVILENLVRSKPSLLHHIARLELIDVIYLPSFTFGYTNKNYFLDQGDDFDLRTQAVGKWP